jgi:hypothetical protein
MRWAPTLGTAIFFVGQHRRHVGLDGAQELQELAAAVPTVRLADHLAGGDVQRCEQCRRAMPLVIVRSPCGRSQRQLAACDPVPESGIFSSTHNTMAISGGAMYSPTMSRTLSTNIGSVDSLKVSWRCGCKPNARQMRARTRRVQQSILLRKVFKTGPCLA